MLNNKQEAKAFISYAHRDKRYFKVLVDGLRSHSKGSKFLDWNVWDDRQIPLGYDWNMEIAKQIAKCDFAILLISSDFLNSDFCTVRELGKFIERNVAEDFLFFPILIRDCEFVQLEQIAKIQLFAAHGDDYGVPQKEGELVAFAELALFDTNGVLIPNPNLDTYYKNLVKAIESALQNITKSATNNTVTVTPKTSLPLKDQTCAPVMTEDVSKDIRILNPKLLSDLGFKYNIYLIKSKSLLDILNMIPDINIEAYQVLGSHDIICKFFENNETLHSVFSKYCIPWYNIQEWRVNDIDRYYFLSEFKYTSVDVLGTNPLSNIIEGQHNWNNISDKSIEELETNNYIFKIPYSINKLLRHERVKIFIFVELPIVSEENIHERNQTVKELLFPKYGNVVSGLYWGERLEKAQCLIECEADNFWDILEGLIPELHSNFKENISTDSFFCIKPLFDKVVIDINDQTITKLKKDIGNSDYFDIYLEKMKNSFEEILHILHKDNYKLDTNTIGDEEKVVSTIFYQKSNNYIQIISDYHENEFDNYKDSIKRAFSRMLYGILVGEACYITEGAIVTGPIVELMLRRTLSSIVFSEIKERKNILKALKTNTIKRSVFPDGLKAFEILNMTKSLNETYPQFALVSEDMLDEWEAFKPLRNMGGHALHTDVSKVKDCAHLGFKLISDLLKIRDRFQEKWRYKFN